MTWAAVLPRYLEALRSLGRAPTTVTKARADLERFALHCGCPPDQVVPRHLVAYRQHLEWVPTALGALRAPSTVAGALHQVRGFFRWAHAQGLVLVDPTAHLVIGRPPQALPRLLTVAEARALVERPDPRTLLGRRDRALLELLYGLGLRRGEGQALDLMDVDRRQEVVRVAPGKTRRGRVMPLGPHLTQVLEAYLDHSRPHLARRAGETALLLSAQGRRLSLPRIEQVVAGAADALGLPGVSPHSLRHACATHMLAAGADLAQVQAWLGHQDIKSTQTYTHLQPLEVFAEHKRTHPRARRR